MKSDKQIIDDLRELLSDIEEKAYKSTNVQSADAYLSVREKLKELVDKFK